VEEWDEVIEVAISELGESFDSHDVIKKVAHLNQVEYISALSAAGSDTPFQSVHSSLGRRIKVVCEDLGFVAQDSRSKDMFGQNSKCQRWSR